MNFIIFVSKETHSKKKIVGNKFIKITELVITKFSGFINEVHLYYDTKNKNYQRV